MLDGNDYSSSEEEREHAWAIADAAYNNYVASIAHRIDKRLLGLGAMLHDGSIIAVERDKGVVTLIIDLRASIFRKLRSLNMVIRCRDPKECNVSNDHLPDWIIVEELFVEADDAIELSLLCQHGEYQVTCKRIEYELVDRGEQEVKSGRSE